MKVLLSGHGEDRAALDAARRAVAHQRLILFTHKPEDDSLVTLREMESLAGVAVEVRPVDPADLLGCLAEARRVIEREAQHDVQVHVAGGSNLVASALLLAAFQHGIDAFYCHPRGVSRLPVILRSDLTERFNEADRAILLALPEHGEKELGELVGEGRQPTTVKASLLRLRALGVVKADHERAELTNAGRYYRRHHARAPEGSASPTFT